MTYYGQQFQPKKPVFSFRDLEVYQKTMECSVIIVKSLKPALGKLKYDFLENMVNCCMSIPLYIGEAHSLRFANLAQSLQLLEKAMASSNKMVIYLEQARGLYGVKVDNDLVEDIVGRYMETRGKMFRLEKSWKKFSRENAQENSVKYPPKL
jgi:23S rRNA-intervening sequence protein